jgi:hypothetical protein
MHYKWRWLQVGPDVENTRVETNLAGANADELLDDVPFGRNKFLKYLAGGLFGAATAFALRDAPAEAHHAPPPYPCYGFPRCHYCNGRICTQYCRDAGYLGCHSGGQCWSTCTAFGLYRCCDWIENFPNFPDHPCVCGEQMATFC